MDPLPFKRSKNSFRVHNSVPNVVRQMKSWRSNPATARIPPSSDPSLTSKTTPRGCWSRGWGRTVGGDRPTEPVPAAKDPEQPNPTGKSPLWANRRGTSDHNRRPQGQTDPSGAGRGGDTYRPSGGIAGARASKTCTKHVIFPIVCVSKDAEPAEMRRRDSRSPKNQELKTFNVGHSRKQTAVSKLMTAKPRYSATRGEIKSMRVCSYCG